MPVPLPNRWLHRFSLVLLASTLLLVALGGVVTTKGVGMAVPDWPTTYGENMFLFHYSKWVGGVFYEHTHRLLASGVGFLTIVLCVWLWLKESRKWLCWLGVLGLVGVIVQGLLGGFRVVFDKHGLGTELGIFHAATAQLFFLLIGSIVLFTSSWWGKLAPTTSSLSSLLLGRKWLCWAVGLIFVQLILGASMRHQHAGLAVPDFPLAYGTFWPAMDSDSIQRYNAQRIEMAGENPILPSHIVLHMLHRYTGLALLVLISVAMIKVRKAFGRGHAVHKLAHIWGAMAGVQVGLGILTILTHRKVDVTTAHVAVGALTFLLGWLLVLVCSRTIFLQTWEQAASVSPDSQASVERRQA